MLFIVTILDDDKPITITDDLNNHYHMGDTIKNVWGNHVSELIRLCIVKKAQEDNFFVIM